MILLIKERLDRDAPFRQLYREALGHGSPAEAPCTAFLGLEDVRSYLDGELACYSDLCGHFPNVAGWKKLMKKMKKTIKDDEKDLEQRLKWGVLRPEVPLQEEWRPGAFGLGQWHFRARHGAIVAGDHGLCLRAL